VKLVIAAAAACAALAAGAGTARADTLYATCFDDGALWLAPLEPSQSDCTPLAAPAPTPPPPAADPPAAVEERGVDVGLGADPNMDPDPDLYATEVLCPDGSIWAVVKGDDFVCP
jgi:hypothetical protein